MHVRPSPFWGTPCTVLKPHAFSLLFWQFTTPPIKLTTEPVFLHTGNKELHVFLFEGCGCSSLMCTHITKENKSWEGGVSQLCAVLMARCKERKKLLCLISTNSAWKKHLWLLKILPDFTGSNCHALTVFLFILHCSKTVPMPTGSTGKRRRTPAQQLIFFQRHISRMATIPSSLERSKRLVKRFTQSARWHVFADRSWHGDSCHCSGDARCGQLGHCVLSAQLHGRWWQWNRHPANNNGPERQLKGK